MTLHSHSLDHERESGERGGLLEEMPLEGSTVRRRLEEFDMDEETQNRWKVLVIPGLCLLIGFLFGISTGALLAAGDKNGGDKSCNCSSLSLAFNTAVKFEPNSTFANASAVDEATDGAWAELNPVGRGFIHIDEKGEPMIFNGSHPLTARTKVVSVFHQLHCLNHLRRSLAASAANPIEYSYLIPQLSRHWDHCFDYLRQALMCSADITLEKLKDTNDGHSSLAVVDGWGTVHMCRDYDAVKKWAADHRASDEGGIN